jgi:cell wall-associated NlpC family hydrolase
MRVLIVLLVLVVGGLHVLDGQLATFTPPQVEPLPTIPARVSLTPAAPVPVVAGNTLQTLFAAARSWLGVPYLFGGCSRHGIDCSCFVQTVLAVVGVHVPRTTVTQKAFDAPVPRDQIAPGDTLFFDNTCTNCGANPTHEALALSVNPPLMIEAGDPVQITSFDTPYWRTHYDSAGRPPGL